MKFYILVYNPQFTIVTQVESLAERLSNATGFIIETIAHHDSRDMPLYLINSEENKQINIGEIDGKAISPLTQVQEG